MNSNNMSENFIKASEASNRTMTLESEDNLELRIIKAQHDLTTAKRTLVVAKVRDEMVQEIDKNKNVYSHDTDTDPDIDKIIWFVQRELFDAENMADLTRTLLEKAGLDASEKSVATVFNDALESVAEQYYSMLCEAKNAAPSPKNPEVETTERFLIE